MHVNASLNTQEWLQRLLAIDSGKALGLTEAW